MKIRPLRVLSVAGAITLLTACGAESGAEPVSSGSGSDKITVGVIPIASNAPIYLGQQEGFFEEEGLELEIQNTVGGAAAVPAVVSGNFDFADSNIVSLLVAADQGLDLEIVAPGSASSGDPSKDATAVIVPEESPISTPADLSGKTISVNTLSNIGDTTISAVVEENGGDPSTIDFVEVPFPEAEAALESGNVDAAWVAEPFLTSALKSGSRAVTYNYADFDPATPIEAYFTTSKFAEENPDIVARFTRAMHKSHEFASSNPDAVREIVGTYTKIDAGLRAEMTLNKYPTEFSVEILQKLADAAFKYGTLQNKLDVSTLIQE
ncbi:ABC transporter substrate-binding protein [Arthrobacter crystallopoietes]|uniref:NitT/TauT family transport system substrate-binding protein n=1 Tax=Crystallibacter crystallopoietes TaxID=37928 RepID=A0A1H1HXQ2_9MICC|nr:ABC transporter substrate-binding protein [Arthrobacter crystallopoietes]AUI53668.1 nitrate ABC transporter substrate-binding protein [Arthrobacter crystallopoietes]SDR30241.1 NitT/TauT family transport system substrate-binding protein [Arthrobacter crystallopoietes]